MRISYNQNTIKQKYIDCIHNFIIFNILKRRCISLLFHIDWKKLKAVFFLPSEWIWIQKLLQIAKHVSESRQIYGRNGPHPVMYFRSVGHFAAISMTTTSDSKSDLSRWDGYTNIDKLWLLLFFSTKRKVYTFLRNLLFFFFT